MKQPSKRPAGANFLAPLPERAPSGATIYRLNVVGKARFLLLAALCVAAGVISIVAPSGTDGLWYLIPMAVAFGAGGVYFALYAARYRIIFDNTSVSVAGPFQTIAMRRDEVAGRRRIQGYKSHSCYRLEGAPGSKGLPIEDDMGFDREWDDWFLSLPTLGNSKPKTRGRSRKKPIGA